MTAPKSAENQPAPDQRPISVRCQWGNGDAGATVQLTRPQWRQICAGEVVEASTWAWYEGKRQRVGFRFNGPKRGDLYVGGGDGSDYFIGQLGEAQVSGAEFPPRQPDATDFTVQDSGALSMDGITAPETRAEAYDLSPDFLRDADGLLSAAEDCPPLRWYLDLKFEDAKETAQTSDPAASSKEAEPELEDWLASLPEPQLAALIEEVREWLLEEPDWGQEDDYIPSTHQPQGAALEFFQDWSAEDLKAVGIVIVEGEYPGSTYYAAELRKAPYSANVIAWQRKLPVWFTPA